ncbi:MAG: hydantoinase/oxoprolinase family protein [Rhodospirillaceae bacterium]|nr:hydantoinase/oxoprolinase family protein [Rhodospirillaceae bacterium]MBT5081404.1 hydantoinase/oxoprolinase family protein [Rhodospirillaceae bacterium]MBT5522888.1 hydantoinase/oxoprolinase family protein [Rhodospirillaceae bacterium]MBT5880877.1 hydantoinase/oxoprolinase family protein [Rhodospirillaceae bacterium]MBT6589754.1 hydantoinase/oxoprolinase family protein [Rhodospirillaceae bacterium]
MVLRDQTGGLWVFKAPSVPSDPSQGVMAVLQRAAKSLDMALSDLLGNCALFFHGSTVATNTILEKKGATVGLLTTTGFRDSLEVRRGIRENMWDHRAPFPDVIVPRYLRQPVGGRLDKDGDELEALDLGDVDKAMTLFADEGVEAIAVALLNSYGNPKHEDAVAEHMAGHLADHPADSSWVSLSSRIAPIMGEYERTSTAVINAYIAPKVVGYLRNLDSHLRDNGLARPILLLQSNGGAVSVEQVAERPVNLVLSGPAAGVGALGLYSRCAGSDNLIAMEIGGTSCDVTLMGEGEVSVTDELMIDGYHLATPSVDIHTVGAGGGTIAHADDAGLLHVGPQGAGATPGPACYGLGGEQPTVTDAYMVLGRLRPGPYAGGSVTLDDNLARRAIEEKIAKPLGIAVEEAAAGIIRLLEQNLLHAVEHISIQRGHNPQRFTLVAAGGAGPMHGATVARALGCRQAYVPRQAGAFCALGMLHTDIRQDYLAVHFDNLDTVAEEALQMGFAPLEERAGAALAAEGFNGDAAVVHRELDLRYRGQLWSIRVQLPSGAFDPMAVREAFDADHQRQYGHTQPGGTIEITALRVTARGLIETSDPSVTASAYKAPDPTAVRPVYMDSNHGWQDTPIYAGADLQPGFAEDGPMLVEELTTTVFVGPRDRLIVDNSDNFMIEIDGAGD